jgi:hypothetical protein
VRRIRRTKPAEAANLGEGTEVASIERVGATRVAMRKEFKIVAGATALAVGLAFAVPGFAQVAGPNAGQRSYTVGGGAANSQGPITTSGGANVRGNKHPRFGNFDGGGSSASTTGGRPGDAPGSGWTGSGGLSGRESSPLSAPNNKSAGSSGWTP